MTDDDDDQAGAEKGPRRITKARIKGAAVAWEKRGGRKPCSTTQGKPRRTRGRALYYVRKRREGGKVVSKYIGTGEIAAVLADLDARDRAEREARREAERSRVKARDDALDANNRVISELYKRIGAVVGAVLDACGYHRHHRGPWRKRRMTGQSRALATAGTRPALPAVNEVGDLARAAIVGEILAAAGGDGEFRASLYRQVHRLERELGGPDPSPLERLLASRVVLCWLQVHRLELLATDAEQKRLPAGSIERRRDRAHTRYLQSIKALAQVRKLALPALLQVNIGEQQVIAPGGIGGKGPGIG